MEVSAREAFFYLIFGQYSHGGNYLCIPNWDVGSELADYSDIFWNTERLSRRLKPVDAVTVARALAAVKPYLIE